MYDKIFYHVFVIMEELPITEQNKDLIIKTKRGPKHKIITPKIKLAITPKIKKEIDDDMQRIIFIKGPIYVSFEDN